MFYHFRTVFFMLLLSWPSEFVLMISAADEPMTMVEELKLYDEQWVQPLFNEFNCAHILNPHAEKTHAEDEQLQMQKSFCGLLDMTKVIFENILANHTDHRVALPFLRNLKIQLIKEVIKLKHKMEKDLAGSTILSEVSAKVATTLSKHRGEKKKMEALGQQLHEQVAQCVEQQQHAEDGTEQQIGQEEGVQCAYEYLLIVSKMGEMERKVWKRLREKCENNKVVDIMAATPVRVRAKRAVTGSSSGEKKSSGGRSSSGGKSTSGESDVDPRELMRQMIEMKKTMLCQLTEGQIEQQQKIIDGHMEMIAKISEQMERMQKEVDKLEAEEEAKRAAIAKEAADKKAALEAAERVAKEAAEQAAAAARAAEEKKKKAEKAEEDRIAAAKKAEADKKAAAAKKAEEDKKKAAEKEAADKRAAQEKALQAESATALDKAASAKFALAKAQEAKAVAAKAAAMKLAAEQAAAQKLAVEKAAADAVAAAKAEVEKAEAEKEAAVKEAEAKAVEAKKAEAEAAAAKAAADKSAKAKAEWDALAAERKVLAKQAADKVAAEKKAAAEKEKKAVADKAAVAAASSSGGGGGADAHRINFEVFGGNQKGISVSASPARRGSFGVSCSVTLPTSASTSALMGRSRNMSMLFNLNELDWIMLALIACAVYYAAHFTMFGAKYLTVAVGIWLVIKRSHKTLFSLIKGAAKSFYKLRDFAEKWREDKND